MLGNDLYLNEVNAELSNERLKSLVFFYAPLIGNDSLALYQYLVLRGSNTVFDELNNLLYSLNISVDAFEKQTKKLNEYRLLKTLNQDNKYIFVFNNPLTMKEFVKNDIFIRDFILKTSGVHYQELVADMFDEDKHSGFKDISSTLSLDDLKSWSNENETYLTSKVFEKKMYDFNTLFDVNYFLKDVSTVLLPLKLRTKENMLELATLADLYNISYDKMRSYLPKVAKTDSNEFDLVQLRYLCMNARTDYTKIEKGNYKVPCLLFLMNLQNGKEVTEYDKKIIHRLSEDYHLNPSVINVLLEYALTNCDNRLIEKYIYAIAADLHRNNINDANSALSRLSKPYNKNVKVNSLPTYDTSKNKNVSEQEAEELLRLMGKK